jgi:hypothetical protein
MILTLIPSPHALSLAFSLLLAPNGYVVANSNDRLALKTLRSPQGEDDPP